MFSITNLMAFIIASAAVIFVPGPATFYVVGKANIAAHRAVWSVAGIVAGDVVLISVAGFGFAAIVTCFPIVLELTKYVGAAYIIYLGVGLLRVQPAETTSLNTQGDRREDLLRGFLLTVTNPKPILFFVAFFPLFIVDETLPYTISFLCAWRHVSVGEFNIFRLHHLCRGDVESLPTGSTIYGWWV